MNTGLLLSARLRRQFAAAEARRAVAPPAGEAQASASQLAAIGHLWADAVRDVPHYASMVASGGAPAVIQTWQDFAAVPALTRQSLQDHPEAFIRLSGPPASYVKTGGSTGTPLQVGTNQSERDLMRIVKLAAWQQLGYTSSSRLFIMWGHFHLLGTGWRGRLLQVRRTLGDAALGYERVSAYRLSPAIAADYAERLIRYRPVGLIGYASALDLFARYAASYRERFRALGLRFVLSTSEPPPRPDSIAMLEDLFGCPVVQEYGGAEFGQVAFKIGAEPFHVYDDLYRVEAEAAPAEEPGAHPLLLTALYPRYLPLVRYQCGDAALGIRRWSTGHVASFEALAGRINDVVHLGGGDAVHSVAIQHCVVQERSVYNVQMALTDQGIELLLVTADADRPSLEVRIRSRLAQVHPHLAAVRFRYVDDLDTNRAGKRRWFVDRRTSPPCAASPAS